MKPPTTETVKSETPAESLGLAPTMAETETIYGMDMLDLELTDPDMREAPRPPKCIETRLTRLDHVWRWMSRPTVRVLGMRMYTTVSPTEEERKKIQNGDCPAGVHVDVENKVCWREDAWLASIPRKQYEYRERQRIMRRQHQTALARSKEPLAEAIARKGGTLATHQVQQWTSADEDDNR